VSDDFLLLQKGEDYAMQRSILVAVDIEKQTTAASKRYSEAVCRAASFLASRLKAGIDLLYVEDMKDYHGDKFDSAGIRAWRFEHQVKLKLLSRQFEMPVSRTVKRGPPAEQILKALHADSAELVVMGTHGRKGVRRLLVGSVAEEVIRHSKRPVMVIGPAARERDRGLTGQKELTVLVATDLGKNSRTAERYALSLAKRMGARVTLFHCLWDSINAILVNAAFSGGMSYKLDEIITETRDDAVDILKKKVGFFRTHGVRCEYKIEDKAILSSRGVYQEGEGGYSFIIMGTRGRNVLLNAFFGSTARETILNASTPVIIVHSGR
jgi:nucleotide-binding universal stress UspA family protein